jgi:hypothetical protein
LSVSPGTLAAMELDTQPLLGEFVTDQAGVVTRSQALAAGVSDKIVYTLSKRGRWQRLYPGVYAAFSGKVGREAALWAAVLYAGQSSALSHQTAAELWGLTDKPSELIHVTVPSSRRVRAAAGIVVHYSARSAVHPARTPPRTRVAETVIDLWETASTLDAAIGWVTRAIGRRRTTADQLSAAAAARSRVRWRAMLAELLDLDGVHSVLEYRYVRDVERRHGLPTATRQLHVRVDGRSQYRDEVYEEYQTVVELDGRIAHPGDTRWDDIRRDNAAASTGQITVRYGWYPIHITPCQTAAQLEEVLMLRGFPGGRPCAPDCPVGRRRPTPVQPAPARPTLAQERSARVLGRLAREHSKQPEAG